MMLGGRRPSDSEYSANNHNHPSDNDNLVGLNPEQRIAMLKAQREKEKEREIAEKERQVKINQGTAYTLSHIDYQLDETSHRTTKRRKKKIRS